METFSCKMDRSSSQTLSAVHLGCVREREFLLTLLLVFVRATSKKENTLKRTNKNLPAGRLASSAPPLELPVALLFALCKARRALPRKIPTLFCFLLSFLLHLPQTLKILFFLHLTRTFKFLCLCRSSMPSSPVPRPPHTHRAGDEVGIEPNERGVTHRLWLRPASIRPAGCDD